MNSQFRGGGDTRQSTHGWPLWFLLVLGACALIFSLRAIAAFPDETAEGNVLTGLLSLFAAALWVGAAAGAIHNGRRMRIAAWIGWTVNLVMPLVGLAISDSYVSPVNPWYAGGATYFYIPTVLSLAALIWMAWSSPSQIASRNGG